MNDLTHARLVAFGALRPRQTLLAGRIDVLAACLPEHGDELIVDPHKASGAALELVELCSKAPLPRPGCPQGARRAISLASTVEAGLKAADWDLDTGPTRVLMWRGLGEKLRGADAALALRWCAQSRSASPTSEQAKQNDDLLFQSRSLAAALAHSWARNPQGAGSQAAASMAQDDALALARLCQTLPELLPDRASELSAAALGFAAHLESLALENAVGASPARERPRL